MATVIRSTEQAAELMHSSLKTMVFRGEDQVFLPGSILLRVATKDVILDYISQGNNLFLDPSKRDAFVEKVIRQTPKMFAICVFGGLSVSDFKILVDLKLTDKSLPLDGSHCPRTCSKRNFSRGFIEQQKKFNTVFFELSSYHSLNSNCSKPIRFDENPSNRIGKGAFGEVYNIELHPDHRAFSSGANKKNQFAMKVTAQASRELDFHLAMAGLDHPHLLKCYASFTFSSKYHMIYEKADCNMEEFIMKNKDAAKIPSLTSRKLAAQLYGLAAALSVIHNQGQSETNEQSGHLGVPKNGSVPSKTGYIHDIKPDNLLMFIYKQDGQETHWLRLSDFSCAKVADWVASISGERKASWRSDSKSGTPVYRAPESMYGKTSRPYDLWSLGCVYLELLVWYLEGFDKLEDFREIRGTRAKPGGAWDEGFYYTTDNGPESKFHLRDIVNDKIKYVIQHSDEHLKHIAKAIPDLLNVNPDERPTAEKLARDLKRPYMEERPPFEAHSVAANGFPSSSILPPSHAHDSGTGSGSESEYGGPNQFKLTVQPPPTQRPA